MTTPRSGKLSSKFTHSAVLPLNEPLGLFWLRPSTMRVINFLLMNVSTWLKYPCLRAFSTMVLAGSTISSQICSTFIPFM